MNPDGDCVGSCMGMALYLRKVMPEKKIDVYLESFNDSLVRNIPGTDTVRYDAAANVEKYDAFICLDADQTRLGDAREIWDLAEVKINIDHHISNPGCGEYNYVDGKASSACELVYRVIDEHKMDAQIAQALYVGMVTDTGVFRFSNTSEETMRIAGKLISFGFDYPSIVREVFYERSFSAAKILGRALERAQLLQDGKLIVSVITMRDMQECGADRKSLDGVASQLALTRGADCAVFLHETSPNIYRGSLRSNNIVNVAEIASVYGGGGHIRAAGCTIDLTEIETTAEALVNELDRAVGRQLAIELFNRE